jgi:hypothetical protein
MGAADTMLFALLALADVSVVVLLHQRRQRRQRIERMMRSLSASVRREIGTPMVTVDAPRALVLQQAS